MLSAENEAALNDALSDLGSAVSRIRALIEKAKAPQSTQDDTAVAQFERELDELEMQFLGVQRATLSDQI